MSNNLATEQIDDSLLIRFTRPKVRNPLSVAVLDELHTITDKCVDRPELSRIIFTGTDNVFASGADLREIDSISPGSARAFALRGQSLMTKVTRLPQITIAAINGYCFGGALDLALACKVRTASPNATFAHPGAGLGIITGWGGTQRLPQLIGQANAIEMFFTAEAIGAERALAIELIDEISDDVVAAALAISTA